MVQKYTEQVQETVHSDNLRGGVTKKKRENLERKKIPKEGVVWWEAKQARIIERKLRRAYLETRSYYCF